MFISFEGTDGSGKTTQISRLVEHLQGRGLPIFATREPGGTPIGDQIREVLHRLDNQQMHPHAEVLLYAASRAQLVAQELRPRLARGEIVICDRYLDSTLAYQGYGHGLAPDLLKPILTFATQGLRPDLTLFLAVSPEQALQRRKQAAQQGAEWNRLDAFDEAFHRRVWAGYQALIAAEPERWVTIDASQPIDAVQDQIRAVLGGYPAFAQGA
ncbi:MAG: dTMP kinase [Anaerolineae bacterium]|nr:dTMP kinase [Anaerolineae bacterium]